MGDFVPFQTLQQLKLKGYKQERKSYEGHIYDVLKWLREEKKIFVAIDYYPAGYNAMIYTGLSQKDGFCDNEQYIDECDCYNTYELAALAGI